MLRPHLRSRAFPASIAALGLICASCYHRSHDDDAPQPPPFDLWELEPNDQASFPDAIGPLAVGDSLIIGGTVTQFGPDVLDGFAFQNSAPCDIQFSLVARNTAADLDVCVYDPQAGAYAFCFENGGYVENGRFSLASAGFDFHLVLSSFVGASEYRLRVDCLPITFGLLAAPEAANASNRRVQAFDNYGEQAALERDARVIARGVAFELDLATDELREVRLEVREARK